MLISAAVVKFGLCLFISLVK